jgi:hypothetical protein
VRAEVWVPFEAAIAIGWTRGFRRVAKRVAINSRTRKAKLGDLTRENGNTQNE